MGCYVFDFSGHLIDFNSSDVSKVLGIFLKQAWHMVTLSYE